jgi:hypothetical protein
VTSSVTVVTETYNLAHGQDFDRLCGVLGALTDAVVQMDGGPHEVLLIDASDDRRVAELVATTPVPAPHTLRHVRVPTAIGYDTVKDLASELAHGDVVVFIDGDCAPVASPAEWLRAMVDALRTTGAPGVTGSTLYDGDTPWRLASSVLDFGFVFDHPGGPVGCYLSNNSAFVRATRVGDTCVDGLRCSCYLHAQRFVRQGTPMRHVDDPRALVRHEYPPFVDERLRRGYDAVVVARADQATTLEATVFRGGRLYDATIGVARFLRRQWCSDRARAREVCALAQVSRPVLWATLASVLVQRAVEVVGMWRAIWLPADARWRHTVSLDDARAYALSSHD